MSRILMIAYTTYVHDARVKRHAEALAQRGDHIDVICLANPEQGLRNGVNVIGLPVPRYRGSSRLSYLYVYLRFFLAATAKAASLGRRYPYDLVIVCTMPDAAVLCAIPARLQGSRVVLDVHDTMPELYADKFGGRRGALGAWLLRLEERASAWAADRVLAVHELHRDRLIGNGVDPDKIRVVLNMPDPRIFAAAAQRPDVETAPQPAPERFTLICHGTIARRLGLDVAVEAIDLLRQRLPTIRLLIMGSGDYLDEIKALVARRQLEQWIEFLPPVALEELPQVLRRADVGLIPNRASKATELMLPVKLLEYVALGVPVVAARLRTVEHYFDGRVRFFEPGDAAALAAAVEDLYLHPALRCELAARAGQVLASIGWTEQCRNFYRAIDSILPPAVVAPAAPRASINHNYPERRNYPERSVQGD